MGVEVREPAVSDAASTPARPEVPEPGRVVEVRGATWAVAEVRPQGLPRSPADEGRPGAQHLVTLQSLDEDRPDFYQCGLSISLPGTLSRNGSAQSSSVVVRQGRSCGGSASVPGCDLGPRTPSGLVALGCGLATICR